MIRKLFLKLKNISVRRVILLLICLFFFSCAKDAVTGKKTYNWYGLNDDIKLGQQVIHQQLRALKKKKKAIDEEADPEMTRLIREITGKIAAISHFPNFPYETHYADLDIVNAWCAPGGKVMVYSGLFNPKEGLVTRSEKDELAAVLGHEIAHATARHVTESLSRNMSLAVIGQAAAIAVGTTGSGIVQDLFQKVISKGIDVFIPAYSRKSESEADQIGLFYMAKAGYNPKAAVDLWYRACKRRGDKTSLFASHPGSCERAKNLEKLLPQAMEEYQKLAH
ncbi:MAG: M48 family metallopeptidase [Deltaproteobacteria bacterium]|nr:M48 family metallopeptidase [Deltaproteobacteria bacterium]